MDDLVRRLFYSLLGVCGEYACGLVVGPNCVVSDEMVMLCYCELSCLIHEDGVIIINILLN